MYLASRSPQRKALLESLGVDFEVVVPEYSEEDQPGLTPAELVERHSCGKALAVASKIPALPPTRPVLGVDTMVVIDGEALGKAASREEALVCLRRLSGKTHRVYSGITLLWAGAGRSKGEELLSSGSDTPPRVSAGNKGVFEQTAHAATAVRFCVIPEPEMEAYIATGEWRHRAGAYAIQGRASAFVQEIRGDYTNVVGLPVPLLVSMLREGGWWPPDSWKRDK